MAFIGMDVAEIERIAGALTQQGEELRRVLSGVDTAVTHASGLWPGQDGVLFHETWHGTHRSSVQSTADDLVSRAAWLRGEIEEQIRTSAGTGAGGRASGIGHPDLAHAAPEQARAVDYLDLAKASYAPTGDVGDWHRLSPEELRTIGIDPEDLQDPSCGFGAAIFRDSAGRYVVAYPGTTTSTDWDSDAIGDVALSKQTERAVALALEVKGAVGTRSDVSFTGHSLGGRLAALSSVATNDRAVTFNAAGASSSELMYAQVAGGGTSNILQYVGSNIFSADGPVQTGLLGIDTGRIDNYQADLDPLSNAQERWFNALPDAVGHQHHVSTDFQLNPLDYHGLDQMRDSVAASDS